MKVVVKSQRLPGHAETTLTITTIRDRTAYSVDLVWTHNEHASFEWLVHNNDNMISRYLMHKYDIVNSDWSQNIDILYSKVELYINRLMNIIKMNIIKN